MNKLDSSALHNRMKELDDPWYTPGDTHLDTSGLSPAYKPKVIEENNFHVPLLTEQAQSKSGQLHQALLNDPEILSELAAKEYRTPEEDQLLKLYEKNPSFTFHTNGYEVIARWERNSWHCAAVHDDGSSKSFKIGGLDRFAKENVMTQAASYLVPPKPWRELSESELLEVARMAPGSPESAIMTHINWSLPDIDRDVSSDPKYQELCDQIIWFVVENHYPEFDEGARTFMLERLGRRPLTWRMAQELFALYKEQQFDSKRRPSRLFDSLRIEPEPEQSLDDLSDEQVKSLRLKTLQAEKPKLEDAGR